MTDIAQIIAGLSPEQRALFEAKLARSVQRTGVSKPIARRPAGAELRPSFGQERLWFLEQLEGSSPLYNISATLDLKGHLDRDSVKLALDEIIARHDALRTRYLPAGGALKLEVVEAEDAGFDVRVVDLCGLPERDREEALRSEEAAEAARPIPLDSGLLIRAVLYRTDADDHTLQLTLHHIASDGWSLGVLVREFAELYDAATTGAPSQLAELPIRYSDYAHWLRETLQGPELEKLTSYWCEHLKGAPYALQIPTDRPRPVSQTFVGKQSRFFLSAEVTRALNEFARGEGATPFVVLLSALYAVLNRYSGQSSILVGSPVAARGRTETEGLIGFFTNTLVMRGDLDGEPTFREFVQRVKRTTLDAYQHQDMPFEKLIERLNPERDLSRSPLVQVMLAMQNSPSAELAGLSAAYDEVHTGTSKFDFLISAFARPENIETWIDYNTALFDQRTIERLWEHLSLFVTNAVAHPDEVVTRIPILTEAEEQHTLVDWNATEMEYPRSEPLAELIEAQVERTPEAIAVVHGTEQVSYRELNERANQLARELQRHGVGPNQVVGICLERSIAMMVALLAVVKSGGAYLPIDPFLPHDRMSYMIEDSGLVALITQESLRLSLSEVGHHVIVVDGAAGREGLISNSRENLDVAVVAEDLAYVIYTSGSTGKPKGVEVSRGALANLLWSMRKWFELSPSDRLLAVTTISFDIAGADIWLPWLVGAQTVLASREAAVDGEQLRGLIGNHGITFLQATPVTWRLLLEAGWPGKPDMQIVCTGEAMPSELATRLTPIVRRLWNMYGPTETTIWSTGYRVDRTDRPVLIGRPVGNTQCYIVSEQMQPVPVGVTGELYIGGGGVAKGYRNRPQLTAEKFLADPFRPGQRMYRTGDLARFHSDGNIECLGRTDHQVKIRGFRIELGEIESLLRAYEGVKQAVVVAREDIPGDKRLVAYIVPEEGFSVSASALRAHLKESLPDYMIPSASVSLDALPLTANGKIDRKALPAPNTSDQLGAGDGGGSYVAPSTLVEERLAAIWGEVLEREQIGIHDNFFDLGGHSLLSMQVVSRIRARLGFEVPLHRFFDAPTISAVAGIIGEIESSNEADLLRLLAEIEAMPNLGQETWS